MVAGYGLSAIFGLSAAVLLVFGLRGRRTDDHPICRRCGFDLHGKPADARCCSECGKDLSDASAIRVGHRSIHRPFILACIPLTFFSVLSVAGYHWRPHFDPEQHKSNATLVGELNSSDMHFIASVELGNRLADGRLPLPDADAISDRALREQANTQVPWDGTWEGWLEYAQESQRLTPDRWDRYALHSLQFHLDIRPVVGKGDPLPIRISWKPTGRGRCFGPVAFKGTIKLGNGIEMPISHSAGQEDAGEEEFIVKSSDLAGLPAGLQVTCVSLSLRLPQVSTRGRFLYSAPGVTAAPGLHLSGQWCLSAGELPLRMVHDPNTQMIEQEAVEVGAVETARLAPKARTFTKIETWTISGVEPAKTIASRVLLRSGSKETELGDFVARAGQSTSMQFEIPAGSIATDSATVDSAEKPPVSPSVVIDCFL